MKLIEKFTLGVGDRFAHQGQAQLSAFVQAASQGIIVHPTWNKSNREHNLIGTEPDSVRSEAEAAVKALGWSLSYYVDADHIGLKTVDRFLTASDFFTLDVADFIGKPTTPADVNAFVIRWQKYQGKVAVPGLNEPLLLSEETFQAAATKFLYAMQEAGRIYRYIREKKGEDIIIEVSVDETDAPQTPTELFLILLALAQEGVPVQTIAPKFTGRFNKGVDYVGDLKTFEKEFDEDLAILAFAVKELGFPQTLKLSVHSGSDKFSLYPIIRQLVAKHDSGLHVKTAGTTWLEEVIGLAEAGGSGLALVKEIYAQALPHFDELVGPYASVIDIERAKLPASVADWSSEQFVRTIRHIQSDPLFNPQIRQFFHVSFKIAAKLGSRYTEALGEHAPVISRNVTTNILDRHLLPLFQKA